MGTTPPSSRLLGALLTAALLMVCARVPLSAQAPTLDPASSGTQYLLAFPDTVGNVPDDLHPWVFNDAVSLYIYSPVQNNARITGHNYNRTVALAANGMTRVDLNDSTAPAPDIFMTIANSPSANTFRVQTDSPVILYCWVMTRAGGEAWTPIPVDKWGTEYHAAVVPGELVKDVAGKGGASIDYRLKKAPSQMVVIASEDNTHVSFTPPDYYRFETEVTNPTVILNRGEAYMLRGQITLDDDVAQWDFGGTRIVADKPIGVVSGNARAQFNTDEVGIANNVYKNMMIEWLSPAEQYGMQFVFMPTRDTHMPGIHARAERRREYVRIYNGACGPLTGRFLQPGGTTAVSFKTRRDSLSEFPLGEAKATYFRTEQPAQAMMHSSAVIAFDGSTPCFRGIPCLSYTAVAPYMVEMVAREQWTTFAPYFRASYPDSMEQYVNVVADTVAAKNISREDGTAFPFTTTIPGTDLIWGTDSMRSGVHYLQGHNGARFYAVAYGVKEGSEYFSPGGTAANPPELRQRAAISYGYPLAPERNVLQGACNVLGVNAGAADASGNAIAVSAATGAGPFAITYRLAHATRAELAIYDATGRRVALLANGMMGTGEHVAQWDAAGVPGGVYFCWCVAGSWSGTVPIIVAR